MGHCPGPFRGYIAFPVPLECDLIHLLLGVLCATLPPLRRYGPMLFVVYQAVEELPCDRLSSFLRDVSLFLTGYVLALAMRQGLLRC